MTFAEVQALLGRLRASRKAHLPTGPKGEKRPAGVNARAVAIARIATGGETETPPLAGAGARRDD
jgi:hypothetical protein